jgi:hypothetical protein
LCSYGKSIKISRLDIKNMCRTAEPPFQVKPINREQVEKLKILKKGNGISNHSESWVFSRKYESLADLGRFVKRLQANPELILDDNQFELASGNHAFVSNEEIAIENPNCSANFRKLRCKIMRKPKLNDEQDVATMQQVLKHFFKRL